MGHESDSRAGYESFKDTSRRVHRFVVLVLNLT